MGYSDRELYGVGGWLTFFLVTLGVISPLVSIGSVLMMTSDSATAGALGDAWDTAVRIEWTIVVIVCLAMWFAVYRFLMVRNWTTVVIGISVIWLVASVTLIVEPLIVAGVLGLPLVQLYGAMGATLVRPLIYAGIWTAYLLKSERVANTYRYPERGDEEALAEVFD
ncbi:DUF2569 family protein [Sphingomonas sp. HF-S3]|uniref:DUF2569 family protein n=1 Tax=Sphingomonas rustica TaxID=3103142 RepID=A0ABV0BAB1_9SPHN